MKIPVFDMGNVLVSVSMDNMYKKFVDLKLFKNENLAYFFMRNIENAQNLNFTTVKDAIEFHDAVNKGQDYFRNKTESYKEISDYWKSNEVWKPNLLILGWLLNNINNFGRFVLASNMGIDHHGEILKSHEFFNNKKLIKCFSFQMGAVKPHYTFWKIFEDNIKDTGLNISDLEFLYIDDRLDYIEGWHRFWDSKRIKPKSIETFQFNSTQQDQSILINKLEAFKKR